MNKKNCIIVHGCPSHVESNPNKRSYDKHWMPWIKKELSTRGISTFIPLMPEPWKPDYNSWKKKFEKNEINANTILIGHSCGCAFLVRWLGETSCYADKLILVAPWKIADKKSKTEKEFYDYPIKDSVKYQVNEVVIFTADNESADGKKSAKIFQRFLGGRLIELKGRGHYIFWDMKTEQFPELLDVILNENI